MSEINKVPSSGNTQDQMLDNLRNKASEEFESAPVVAVSGRAPKEMRIRNSKMVIRGLIMFMTVLVMLEGVVIFRVESTPVPANFDTRVPVTVQRAPAPEVFAAPPVEGLQPPLVIENPAELAVPFPDELNADIASGEVAPLPAEFPPPDFSEDEVDSDT